MNCLYRFGSNLFEITVTSRQLDRVLKNTLETANSETAYSCSFPEIEKPSLYAAAGVARSMSISLVDRSHAVWNAIFDDVKC